MYSLTIEISIGLEWVIDNGIANLIITIETTMKPLAGVIKWSKLKANSTVMRLVILAEMVQVFKEEYDQK